MTRPSPPFFNLIIFSLLLRVRSIYFCISATPHRITSEIGHLVLPPTPLTDPPPRYPPRSYPRLISLYPVTLTPFLTEPDLGYVDLLDFYLSIKPLMLMMMIDVVDMRNTNHGGAVRGTPITYNNT